MCQAVLQALGIQRTKQTKFLHSAYLPVAVNNEQIKIHDKFLVHQKGISCEGSAGEGCLKFKIRWSGEPSLEKLLLSRESKKGSIQVAEEADCRQQVQRLWSRRVPGVGGTARSRCVWGRWHSKGEVR